MVTENIIKDTQCTVRFIDDNFKDRNKYQEDGSIQLNTFKLIHPCISEHQHGVFLVHNRGRRDIDMPLFFKKFDKFFPDCLRIHSIKSFCKELICN